MLAETGAWRDSDVMDGSDIPEPVATLKRLLLKAKATGADVYIFGRTYAPPDKGIHDVHMNHRAHPAAFSTTATTTTTTITMSGRTGRCW